jgi:hypothetical protein
MVLVAVMVIGFPFRFELQNKAHDLATRTMKQFKKFAEYRKKGE